jgi:Tetratricopeptide repeat
VSLIAAGALLVRVVLCAAIAGGGGYWVIASWMNRRLSATEAVTLLAGLVVLVSFGVRLATRASTGAFALLMALVAASVWGLYSYSNYVNRRTHQSFDEEDIAAYQAALELDPRNVAAHSLLAKTYRRQGRLELALEEYQAALRLDPSLQEERYWAARLKQQLEAAAGREARCPHCGATGPPVDGLCQGCGQPLPKRRGGEV